MGNAQIQNSDNYLCDGGLPSTSVLSQTSLRPLCHKNGAKTVASSVCRHNDKENIPQTTINIRNRLVCSDQKKLHKACTRSDTKQFLTENDFHILKVLGAEGFGKMYLVKKNDDGKMYTMKTVDKRKIATLGCFDSIESERLIFEKANHPYIPKLKYTFENDKKIFFMFDHIEGDKLNVWLHNLTKFSEEITRFYTAEIITALEYLHKEMRTSYQDLETDHIRLDDEGHINLTDFAHAKSLDLDEESPDHKTINQKAEDFYHLGCLIYELLAGEKIPAEENRQNPSKKLSLSWPKHVSKTARDLITRLISSKTNEKFGFTDILEIKKHKFFMGVNWDKIEHKLMYPPLSPPKDKDEYIQKDDPERNFSFNNFPYSCELDEIMERQPKQMKPDYKRKIMI